MMTTRCKRTCNLNSLMNYFDVKIHDIWEGHMTTRREIETELIHSVGFRAYKRGSDITEVTVYLQK